MPKYNKINVVDNVTPCNAEWGNHVQDGILLEEQNINDLSMTPDYDNFLTNPFNKVSDTKKEFTPSENGYVLLGLENSSVTFILEFQAGTQYVMQRKINSGDFLKILIPVYKNTKCSIVSYWENLPDKVVTYYYFTKKV